VFQAVTGLDRALGITLRVQDGLQRKRAATPRISIRRCGLPLE